MRNKILAIMLLCCMKVEPITHLCFVLIGQSNMVGLGGSDSTTWTHWDIPDTGRIKEFTRAKTWAPAGNMLKHWDHDSIYATNTTSGLGIPFAKRVLIALADTNYDVYLIPNARGGTSISLWRRGQYLYDSTISRVNKALETPNTILAGVLWHQGENDVSIATAYGPKLDTLVQQLRNDLNSPTLPFIAGQIYATTNYPTGYALGGDTVNNWIANLQNRMSNCGYASKDSLTCVADSIHFEMNSLRILGYRYERAWTKIYKGCAQ